MRLILGVTLLSALVVVGVAGFGLLSDSEFGSDFRAGIQKSTQFPVSLAGRTVQRMEAMNWDIAVMDESAVSVYDSKGTELQRMEHGYASPVLRTSGGRLLVYDQGGNRFKVGSESRELFSGESVSPIHAADVAADGTFAIATSSTKSAAEVKVYNEYGNEIFTWQSTSMVVSLALSPDGRRAAVCSLSAENGAVITSLSLLDLQNPKLVFKEDFPEEFGYVTMFGPSSILLITDQSVKSVGDTGRVREEFDFAGRQIQRYAVNGENLVIVLGGSRYMRSSQIVMLDGSCREQGQVEAESAIGELYAAADGFCYLNEGVVYRYDLLGTPLETVNVPGALHVLPLGQDLYIATYEQLQCQTLR